MSPVLRGGGPAGESHPHRIAAIDIGTNSAHLVIAEMDDGGEMRVLESDKGLLRLGAVIDEDGNILEEGIRRTVDTIKRFVEISHSYGATIRAVGTHAAREAANGQELLDRIRAATGVTVEIIDGVEEARLVFLGMRYGLTLTDIPCLAVDVGGGSTEVIVARDDEIRYAGSFKLGAVTLTHRYTVPGAPGELDVDRIQRHIQTRLAPLDTHNRKLKYQKAIATAGTAKALGRIHIALAGRGDQGDLNGHEIPFEDLQGLVAELKRLRTPKAIAKRTGIDSARAEIILAGAMVLEEVSRLFKVETWAVSTWGLREGLVADTFHRMSGRDLGMLPDVQWHSVKQFAKRLRVIKGDHHKQVAQLALTLFENLAPICRPEEPPEIRERDRELLRGAAYLHEAGKFLSEPQYHKHSYYLIANSRLPGFTTWERQMMALIARFHRKGLPTRDNDACRDLSPDDLQRLRFLSALLRLAAALDRSRKSRVRSVDVTDDGDSLTIHLGYDGDRKRPEVELHKANLERRALEKSFGRSLNFALKPLVMR